MKISEQAVDRPRLVWVLTLFILVLSAVTAPQLSIQRTPAISTPVVVVAVPYLGAKPTEVEDLITRKIEERLQKLDRVDWMVSRSMRGSSVTTIIFLDDVDPHQARTDVEHLVNEVRNELPAGREVQPLIQKIDFESAPIMLVSLTGPRGFDERMLRKVAEEVQEDLETIDGVTNTGLFGGREREIQVNFYPDLLDQYGISLDALKNKLAQANATLPAGTFDTKRYNLQVRSETRFLGVDDIRDVVLKQEGGRIIRLRDVAEVLDTYERPRTLAQLDGRENATIVVNKEPNINTLATAERIKERVEELKAKYPQITFTATRDISEEIDLMFHVLGSSAVFGAILVLVILCVTMGFRIASLVLLSIPLSSAVALVFLYGSGMAVSNMAIFSYILVLGVVVDGAIIVAENIYRHLERGETPVDAAKLGIREVGIPVLAADLTTVAAFLPMLLVPGILGDFLSVMPKVVCVALIGSVLVDHFLIPVIASQWYRPATPQEAPQKTVEDPPQPRKAPSLLAPFVAFARAVAGVYERSLRYALRHRWVVVTCCVYAVGWAFLMIYSGAISLDFFPSSDRGQFQVNFELPLGYSIEETRRATAAIVEPILDLRETGELKHVVTALGSSQAVAGALDSDQALGPEFGKIMVELTPPTERTRHQNVIINELREKIKPYPGLKYSIDAVQEGPPGGAAIELRMLGDDLDHLGSLADELMNDLRQIRGTVEVRTGYRPDNPEIVVEPYPDVLGLLGISQSQVAEYVATATLGDSRLEMVIDDEEVPVRIQVDPELQQSPEDIRRLMITSPDGRRMSIGELGEVRRELGLFSIRRHNRRRAISVYSDLVKRETDPENGTYAEEVFGKLRTILPAKYGFRPGGSAMTFIGTPGTKSEGVRIEFTGENEEQRKNFGELTYVMAVAVLLIFVILVCQFNSFRQAVIVLFTIPLSFVGVVAGMWICGFPFSLASFIGLVSLSGIVVNDAIVMVDFANQSRGRGLPLYEALVEAGCNRLRPVILTTVTTIGGLLPLYLNWSGGAEFWQPLTGAIIFGLLVATMLTLVVIPVFYSLAYQWDRPLAPAPAAQARTES